MVDIKTRQLVQKVPTWNGARSLGVNLATNKVYVATTAKGGPCGGCIVAFAPECMVVSHVIARGRRSATRLRGVWIDSHRGMTIDANGLH